MIARDAVKRESARLHANASLVERDYVAGWLLRAIADSSISEKIAFRGGTALSRLYYWGRWRHSEDLDFSASDGLDWDDVSRALGDEVPTYLQEHAQMHAELRRRLRTSRAYAQARIKYVGPLGPNTIKVEMTRSSGSGIVVVDAAVPGYFDCPEFRVRAHSLETVMAEKMLALVRRGYARDYYDVWRLFRENDYDAGEVRRLFASLCRSSGTEYGTGRAGAEGAADDLEPYARLGLFRMLAEDIPPVRDLVDETRRNMEALLGARPRPTQGPASPRGAGR